MLTNKKRLRGCIGMVLLAAAVAWLSGCTPAGPRALLRGKRLMEEGKYADAVEELKTATSLLPTNALAWNYLGLACHHANQPAEAADAYYRALKLNHDLVVVHYDLGCLLLEENRPDTLTGARDQLTAFVLRQENSTDGWLKLGIAQLRLGESSQAETSFKNVLRLSPQNVEAMNDLGVIQLDRRRYRDATAWFNAALKIQPNYPPALLNYAVTEGYMNHPSAALEKYHAYLAIEPRPANWDAVNAIAQQLDQQLNPQLRAPTNLVASATPITNNQIHQPTPPTNLRAETMANEARPTAPANLRPIVSNEPAVRPEVVRLPEAPPVKTARNTPSNYPSSRLVTSDSEIMGQPTDLPEETKSGRRGFFSKVGGLFHRSPQPPPKTIPIAPVLTSEEVNDVITVESNAPTKTAAPPRPVFTARYPYLSSINIVPGDRAQAERYVAQGVEAQRDRNASVAERYFRAAAQADPSYFDAQSSLGLAAFDAGDLPEALRAYEFALAIKPDSFIARYNFALALKRANYITDAAQELERLLTSASSNESPEHLAMVHLTLANLYAEQFHQNGPARAHYLKVLQLDPHNSQATSIRYWLQENG